MNSRYDVILNGVHLNSISEDILVLDVMYSPLTMKYATLTVAKRYGSRINRKHIESVSATVYFEIHAYDTADRQAICEAVAAWARNGGALKTNDRPGQVLMCVCTEVPVIQSVKNWTDPVAVTFTAFEMPFWQGDDYESVTMTGTDSGDTLDVPGNIDGALVEVDIVASGSLTTIALTVNGRTLTLSDLSISSGQDITISYDAHGIQAIRSGNTSLLNKRTGVDDLLANCGANACSFSADGSVSVTFKAKGCWA